MTMSDFIFTDRHFDKKTYSGFMEATSPNDYPVAIVWVDGNCTVFYIDPNNFDYGVQQLHRYIQGTLSIWWDDYKILVYDPRNERID